MISLRILPDGDGQLPELKGATLHHVHAFTVTGLAGGMESGKPSVAIVVPLADGSFVFAETSLALFLSAAEALKARHGDPRQPSVGKGAH